MDKRFLGNFGGYCYYFYWIFAISQRNSNRPVLSSGIQPRRPTTSEGKSQKA